MRPPPNLADPKAPHDLARIWPRLPHRRRLRIAALVWRTTTPFPIRFALLHSLATLFTLLALPPQPTIPPIMIPITWAASYATAVTLYPLVFRVK